MSAAPAAAGGAAGAAGTLWLVGTPIGNRDDLAPRAREVLGRVPTVACEDTRTGRRLFHWLGLPAPELLAYHDHNEAAALPKVLERLERGADVALVSEAGMPAIQDPGYRLVVAARRRGVQVVPVPGPSALLVALAAAGLPTDRFAFLGFAPRRGRAAWWEAALARGETLVVYEAPGRVAATLAAIAVVDGARPLALARELTKLHEEFLTGSAAEVAAEALARGALLKGECVIVVAGASEPAGGRPVSWREALDALAGTRAGRALTPRDRVDVLACAYPGERKAIYRAVLAEGEASA